MFPAGWVSVSYFVAEIVRNLLWFLYRDSPLFNTILSSVSVSLSTVLLCVLAFTWNDSREKALMIFTMAYAVATITTSALTLADVLPTQMRMSCALTFLGVDLLLFSSYLVHRMFRHMMDEYFEARRLE